MRLLHVLGPLALVLAAGLLAGCATLGAEGADAGLVQRWSSSKDGSLRLAEMPAIALEPMGGSDADTITVDPAQRYQAMVGFGAAMTDASAELFMRMPDPVTREALLDDLFRPDRHNLSFMRLPIGASDFSREHYSFDDMPSGQTDPGLAHFTLARAGEQIAAARAATARNASITLMASPWSAPGWMKSSDSLIKGSLLPSRYADFANYFDRYLTAMEREGLSIDYISIQNEPHFEPADYPGMRVDPASRAAFVGKHLGPLLARRHRGTKILDWDHNWDEPDSPTTMLSDGLANRYVSGIAWHCYAGEVEAQGTVQAAYPDKDVFFTECSGGAWASDWGETLGWMTAKLVIGATRNWSRGTLLWNLALDPNGGPHKGGCGNCRGVVTIDGQTGEVTRNVEYFALGHASRFVRRGAERIASDEKGGVLNVAWRNPDGGLVLLAHNPGKTEARIRVRAGKRGFSAILPAGEVSTFVWSQVN